MGLTGFYWVLPNFTGFYRVLLPSYRFFCLNRVLPSFTEFYLVFALIVTHRYHVTDAKKKDCELRRRTRTRRQERKKERKERKRERGTMMKREKKQESKTKENRCRCRQETKWRPRNGSDVDGIPFRISPTQKKNKNNRKYSLIDSRKDSNSIKDDSLKMNRKNNNQRVR